jgi:DNA-binding transcriptional MerR regulator/methylmalonyl-CoA mutase cobalamin-binding subunit
VYTIKEASARSGVDIPLLRAWERRYGVVSPTRTASGYRLYDDSAIDRLRAMRQLIADGWSARQAAAHVREMSRREIAVLARPVVPAATGDGAVATEGNGHLGRTNADALIERLLVAARELDMSALEASLDGAFALGRFESVADRIVMPALRAIGDAWERGEVSVAGEHAASQAVLRRLAMAYEAAADPPADRPILVGMGPGSRHELGAFAFAVAARRAGLPALYLGPDLPTESWVAAAMGREARAAVIGTPTRADIDRARRVVDALRAAQPNLVIALGGKAADRAAGTTGTIALPPNLAESVATLRAMVEA